MKQIEPKNLQAEKECMCVCHMRDEIEIADYAKCQHCENNPSPTTMKDCMPILGWEGYEIDKKGNVWSRRDGFNQSKTLGEKRLLKPFRTKRGYLSVTLRSPGKRKAAYVHRLLSEAFIPNPDNKPFVCHKDGNPLNNSLDNLYWGTAKENLADAKRHGTWWSNKKMKHCQPSEEKRMCIDCKKYPAEVAQTICEFCMGISNSTALGWEKPCHIFEGDKLSVFKECNHNLNVKRESK